MGSGEWPCPRRGEKKSLVDLPPASPGDGDGASGTSPQEQRRWPMLRDVIGLAEAKEIVRDALINPLRHPDIFRTLAVAPGAGLLLYGLPGTGKTMFAKAVANELEIPFLHCKMSELRGVSGNATEANVSRVFAQARDAGQCVLFLDECDAMLYRRGNQRSTLVEQFLVELDGFKDNASPASQVFVMLATNRPWLLDPAILRSGRISTMVHIDLPNAEARREIIRGALQQIPLSSDVDLEKLVTLTDGYSSAELFHREHGGGVCDEAKRLAVRRWIERRDGSPQDSEVWSQPEAVRWEDFQIALKKVVPIRLAEPELVRQLEEFRGKAGADSVV